jgi:hypothetical protein
LLTANTALDGTGTLPAVFTAHATMGGYLERVFFKPLGSTTAATVIRFFLYHPTLGTSFFRDYSLPVATLNNAASMATHELSFNLALAPGEEIRVALGTTVTAGWKATGCGSHYAAAA